jgi:murein DD-endopeptidase MepM/ murein hydrolase activator NlpD
VQFRGFHSRSGNYVVIDGAGTGVDYVYAHLRDPGRFAVGRHVFTGQLIGFVGRTGDASACHLHFETWSPAGWYSGGAPFDPAPWLRAWDKTS